MALPCGEKLAIAVIGQQDHPVRELRIKLGQGEDRPVTVGRLDHEVECNRLTPQLLPLGQTSFLEDLKQRDPLVPRVFPVVGLGLDSPPGKLRQLL